MLCYKCDKNLLVGAELLTWARMSKGGVICQECASIIKNPWYKKWQIWLIIIETIAIIFLLVWVIKIKKTETGGDGDLSGSDNDEIFSQSNFGDRREEIRDEEEEEEPDNYKERKHYSKNGTSPVTPPSLFYTRPTYEDFSGRSYDEEKSFHSTHSSSSKFPPFPSTDINDKHKQEI